MINSSANTTVDATSSEAAPPRLQGGGSLTEDALYVERAADQEIYDALLAGEVCYVLAPRQMGKSSLCNRAARRLRRVDVECVHIDLNVIGGQVNAPDVDRWYYSLLKELSRRLGFPRGHVDQFFEHHEKETPAYRWRTFLREEILGTISGKVVLIFDEIDTVLSLPFASDDFFAVVRDAYNSRAVDPEYRRLAFCFVGVATPAQLMRNALRTPFNVGRGIVLSDFQYEQLRPFTEALVTAGHEHALATRLVQELFAWTAGHPYMTHTLCAHLIGHLDHMAQAGQASDGVPASPAASAVHYSVQALFLTEGQAGDTNLQYAGKRLDSIVDPALRTRLLRLYRRLLDGEDIAAEPNEEVQAELRLCGLVRFEAGRVHVRNRIFASVYDARWVRERELVRALDDAIERWKAGGKKPDDLLAGQALAEAWQWAQEQPRTTPEENEFLLASMDSAKQRAGRRALLATLTTLVVLAVCGLIVVVFWLDRTRRQEQAARAEVERQKEKTALSEQLRLIGAQKLEAEQQKVLAERQNVESEKRNAEIAVQMAEAERSRREERELSLREKEKLLQESQQNQKLAQDNAALAQKAQERAEEEARKQEQLREESELSKLPLLLKEPGSRLRALAQSLVAIDANERNGKPIPENLLSTLLQVSGEFIHSFALKHEAPVLAVRFSEDGKFLTTGCTNGRIYVWDVGKRSIIRIIQAHQGSVRVIRFRPRVVGKDSRTDFFASGGDDGQIHLWHPSTGNRSATFPGHRGAIRHLDFSSDGSLLASSSADQTVRVWNLAQQAEVSVLPVFKNSIVGINFINLYQDYLKKIKINESDILLIIDELGNSFQWGGTIVGFPPIVSKEKISSFLVDRSEEISNYPHPRQHIDAMLLALQGGRFRYLRANDIKNDYLYSFSRSFDDYSKETAVSFDKRGDWLFAGYPSGIVHVAIQRGPRMESVHWTLEGHSGAIRDLHHDYSSKRIASASEDGSVRVWDFRDSARAEREIYRYNELWKIDYSRHGRSMFDSMIKSYTVGEKNVSVIYSENVYPKNKLMYSFACYNAQTGAAVRPVFPKGKSAGYYDEMIGTKSIGSFLLVLHPKPSGDTSKIGSGYCSDARSPHEQNQLRAWESITRRPARGLILLQSSRDNKRLAFEDNSGNLTLLDVDNAKLVPMPSLQDVDRVQFTPDSASLLVLKRVNHAHQLFRSETGQLLRSLDELPGIVPDDMKAGAMGFSADSRHVLISYSDRVARLWDLTTGRYLRAFVGHEDRITAMQFSADGKQVTTAGLDNTVILWDLASGTRLFSWNTQTQNPIGLSDFGRRVLLSNSSRTISIRLATPEPFYAFACRLLSEFDEHKNRVADFCARHTTHPSAIASPPDQGMPNTQP